MLQPRSILVLAGLVVSAGIQTIAQQPRATPAPPSTVLLMTTVKGDVEIETLADAPKSVARVLELVGRNFYRGVRVHDAQPGLIQFGDPATRNMQNSANWGYGGSGRRLGFSEVGKRAIVRGIVGYAYPRGGAPEDADSLLFIARGTIPSMTGRYVVVGRVTRGMDVVDKLQYADVIRNVVVKPAAPAAAARP